MGEQKKAAPHRAWAALAWLAVSLPEAGRAEQAREADLVEAVRGRHLEAVRGLLRQGVNVNATERDGSTGLLWAVYQDDLEMAQALVAAGADVEIGNRLHVTPLLLA